MVKRSKNSRDTYVFVLTARRSDLKIAVLPVENTAVLATNRQVIDHASDDQLVDAPTAQADFGTELRRAREKVGVTLRAIADTTKLPMSALRALEDNRIDQLPGGIYRRAIVRAYAAEIGLDSQQVVRAFVERYPDELASNVPVVVTQPRSFPRVLGTAISLVGTLVPAFAGAFYFASGTEGSDSPRQIVDVLPARADERVAADAVPAVMASANAVPMIISVSSSTRLAVIADGREVVARQLEAGEVIRLTVSDDVVLMGDNAGAVHFSINGRAGRALGDDGVPLSARIPRDDYLSWLIHQ